MRHRRKGRKFGRETKPRRALMRSLANALIAHGKIQTTEAKAKSLRVFIEKMVTKSKAGGIAVFRELGRELDQKAVTKLTGEIAPRFNERRGGYTRIIKLNPRVSDGSPMAIIELVD